MKDSKVTVSLPLLPVSVVLAILKMAKVINISWSWVFAPLWIPLALFLFILGVMALLAAVVVLLDLPGHKNRRR